MKRYWPLAVISGLFLAGCTNERIVIQTKYVGLESLASYHVETPDPLHNHPPIGQQLIVSWSIPQVYLEKKDLHMNLVIRFRNHEEIMETIPLTETTGTYIYSLMNEAYCEKGGLLTYRADICGAGCVLDSWQHQLWFNEVRF